MKRYIIMIVMVLLTNVFLCGCVDTTEDTSLVSDLVSEEMLAQIPLQQDDLVIPVYYIGYYYELDDYDSIPQIFEDKPEMIDNCTYFVYTSQGRYYDYTFENGILVKKGHANHSENKELQAFTSGIAVQYLGQDVELLSACLLKYYKYKWNEYVLYFITTKGAYVYLVDENTEYLYSAEVYYAHQKAFLHNDTVYQIEHDGTVGGYHRGNWDLSAYIPGTENFDPNAKFPKIEKDVAYLESEKMLTKIMLDIGIGAALVLVVLQLVRMKKPTMAMKKRYFILAFAGILVLILLLDHIALNGILTRDVTSKFVKTGMTKQQVTSLIGSEIIYEEGSPAPTHPAYDLLYDQQLYIVYSKEDDTVKSIWEYERTYPLRGCFLPVLLLEILLLEIILYILLKKWRPEGMKWLLRLRLILVFLSVLLFSNIWGHYILRQIMPELYLRRNMEWDELVQLMGKSHYSPYVQNTGKHRIYQWDLFLKNTLTSTYYGLDGKACVYTIHISGLGDPTFLRWCKPLLLAIVGGAEILCYFRIKRKANL